MQTNPTIEQSRIIKRVIWESVESVC